MKNKLGEQLTKYRYRLLYGIILIFIGAVLSALFPPFALIGLFGLSLVLSFSERTETKYMGTFPVRNGEDESLFALFHSKVYVHMPLLLKYLSVFYYWPVWDSYGYLINSGDPKFKEDEADKVNIRDAVMLTGRKLVEISEEDAMALLNGSGEVTNMQRVFVSAPMDAFTEATRKLVDDGLMDVLYRSPVFAILRLPSNIYAIAPYWSISDAHLGYLVDRNTAELFLNAPEKWSHYIFHKKEYPAVTLRGVKLTEATLKYFAQLPASDSAPDLENILREMNRVELTRSVIAERLAKEPSKVKDILFMAAFTAFGIAGTFLAHVSLILVAGLCGYFTYGFIRDMIAMRKLKAEQYSITVKTVEKTKCVVDADSDDYDVYFTDGTSLGVKPNEFSQFSKGDECYTIMLPDRKSPMMAFSKSHWKLGDDLRPKFQGDPARI